MILPGDSERDLRARIAAVPLADKQKERAAKETSVFETNLQFWL